MSMHPATPAVPPPVRSPRELLRAGVEHERYGRLPEALDLYAAAIECGGPRDAAVVSEALRHLALLHHLRAEPEAARDYGERAVAVALEGGATAAAAEALNALVGFAFEAGRHEDAGELVEQALQLEGAQLFTGEKVSLCQGADTTDVPPATSPSGARPSATLAGRHGRWS